MTNYLIIDSNKHYAERLHSALPILQGKTKGTVLDPSKIQNLAALSEEIFSHIQKKPESIILVNAEGKIKNGSHQDQELVELAFWLRCKHKIQNVIVFYSLQSISTLLATNPTHFILHSPGCYHLRLPLSRIETTKIDKYQRLDNLKLLKPFLKPRLDLTQTRHAYANYAGMALMLNVAFHVWKMTKKDLTGFLTRFSSSRFFDFRKSLDYALLVTYFDLNREIKPKDFKHEGFKLAAKTIKTKNILLIDDLAEQGWRAILSQILYGHPNQKNLLALESPGTSELDSAIGSHKPHLILLDLRLENEKGTRNVEELGGFKLLSYLKSKPRYKGLPIIMFTASSNSETTKRLIEAGAEAVWTKPGIDEGLSPDQILERYKALVRYVEASLCRFERSLELKTAKNFEATRLDALRHVQFINYRARLASNQKTPFSKYTDIFIDTNILLKSVDAIGNIYKLAHICELGSHVFTIEGRQVSVSCPKLIFHNFVVDELIEISKAVVERDQDLWKLALFAYETIRSLLGENLARTEFNSFNKSGIVEHTLRPPLTTHYADPEIIEDIGNIISHVEFQLTRRFQPDGRNTPWHYQRKKASYQSDDSQVLLITNESRTIPGRIPDKLRAKLRGLDQSFGSVRVLNYEQFKRQIDRCAL